MSDPILEILKLKEIHGLNSLIRHVMVEFNLFADEAWWKIRSCIDTHRDTVEPLLSTPYNIVPNHRRLKFVAGVSVVPRTDVVPATLLFYDNPVQFRQKYSDSGDTVRLYETIRHPGLNTELTLFLQRSNVVPGRDPGAFVALKNFFFYLSHFYYTATEEEWCFLIEQFSHYEGYAEILSQEIQETFLYTEASIWALARYNLLNTQFQFSEYRGPIAGFLYHTIDEHLNRPLELMIKMGIEEKVTILHVEDGLETSGYEFESGEQLIRLFMEGYDPRKMQEPSDFIVLISRESRQREWELYLRTLATYNILKRSPLLMFRQRYWEEYWKKVEATE
jgi:hypothetical protein